MKKYLLLLLAAVGLAFSCTDTSSIEKKLSELESRVDAISIEQINANAYAYRLIVDESIYILSITEREDGYGYDIELSNGETISIYLSSEGEGVCPIIGLNEDGDWIASMDGGKTWELIEGASNALLESPSDEVIYPQIRVNDNQWEISVDGGATWTVLTDSEGNAMVARNTEALTDSFFSAITYDDETITLVLASGETVVLNIYQGLVMSVADYVEGMTIGSDTTVGLEVSFSSDVVEALFIDVPSGWTAEITEDGLFLITTPADAEEGLQTIKVCIASSKNLIKIYSYGFNLVAGVSSDTCSAWNNFAAASDENVLLDFSYAGYNHGLSLPSESWNYAIYNVCDYGAVPNDGTSDRAAFLAALEAAIGSLTTAEGNATVLQTPHKASAKAIIYFPEGEFILHDSSDDVDGVSQSIVIRAGDFIIKGAGSEKTSIVMNAPMQPTDESVLYSSPEMIIIKHNTGFASLGCSVIADAAKGSFAVEVSSASGLAAGDWVCLSVTNAKAEAVASELSPYSADASWTIATEGVQVQDIHQIASIQGNVLTFAEPLMHEVDASWGWEIQSFSHYENVGVEDLTFVGQSPETFVHHGSWIYDGGYKPIDLMRVANSWVRRVNFVNVSEACSIINSANVSAYDIQISGNQGHAAVRAQASSRVFLGAITDLAGQYHSVGVSKQSMGTVIYKATWTSDTCFESHASQPRATLFDNCEGGLLYNHAGGDSAEAPNHLADLTLWNFNATASSASLFHWWDDSNAYWKFLPPVIVGCNIESADCKYSELQGSTAYPESLYAAQLKLRLGYVPVWLTTL